VPSSGQAVSAGFRASSMVPGQHPRRFEWKPSFVLKPGSLSRYAGDFFSEELGATYRVTPGDSTITLRTGAAPGLTARPVFGDTFVSGQLVIEFRRHGGKVAGFALTHPRARRLTFLAVEQH
jgi:hypothetical protein